MIKEYPQFFTATVLEWRKLLTPDKYKDVIIQSLKFLADNNRIFLNGFVMTNHLHIVWQMKDDINPSDVQRDFLKFTAQQIRFGLIKNHPDILEQFKVNQKDRSYQIWEHRPLSVPLWTISILEQKLDYIHNNPVREKWKLADLPEDYYYSSASFYLLNRSDFNFISHYKG